ncbi:MAG: glycine cleavage system protein GcvH [Hungatella sp.]
MNFPKALKYAKSHEWVEFENADTAKIGLSDYAQNELGDLVFVNLPEVGDEVTAGEPFGDVESVKAVSDVYAPLSGVVVEVNEELFDMPEMINTAPYEAWMIKVGSICDSEDLLDADSYEALTKEA